MEEFNREEYLKYFKPTYLYIKQHKITGLKYFGKTFNDPLKYQGSGTKWKSHMQYYGKEHVETIWYQLFDDIDECRNYALKFSEENDIVNSNEWANLILEDGLWIKPETRKKMSEAKLGKSSHMKGKIHSEETKQKIRIKQTGKKASEETKKKMSESGGHSQTEESKQKIRETLTGVKHDQERVEKMRASKLANPSRHRAGAVHSIEAKEKNRLAHLGKTFTKTPCLGCDKHIATQHMKRHMTKCKGINV